MSKRIEITIAGRVYPLQVEASEVKVAIEAQENINKDLKALQKSFGASSDKQDLLSMLVFRYKVDALDKKEEVSPNPQPSSNNGLLENTQDAEKEHLINKIDNLLSSIDM